MIPSYQPEVTPNCTFHILILRCSILMWRFKSLSVLGCLSAKCCRASAESQKLASNPKSSPQPVNPPLPRTPHMSESDILCRVVKYNIYNYYMYGPLSRGCGTFLELLCVEPERQRRRASQQLQNVPNPGKRPIHVVVFSAAQAFCFFPEVSSSKLLIKGSNFAF